tara:strand:+ start:161 stop:688 length:528 start_codon:yes stop_codon:yes gene_type:complete
MIYYNDFRIRRISIDDAKFMTELRSDPSTNSMLGHFIFVNEEGQQSWISKINQSIDALYFIFEINNDNEWIKIGLVRINHIDYINRSASVGGDISKKFRGNGYSKEMFKIILQLGFEHLNLNRLWLHVLENNDVAINLYKKVGFAEEGIQRKAVFRNGRYLDYIMMSILNEEYIK